MPRSLPTHPSLVQLRNQAKDLLKQQQGGAPTAIARFRAHHPRLAGQPESAVRDTKLSLSDAQLVIAREYGWLSWPKLKSHVDGLQKVDERVAFLRHEFAAADDETRKRLLSRVHSRERFQDYNPSAAELSERDARLVIANEAGFPFWRGYEIYLYLDPDVREVIAAARHGELSRLVSLLRANPHAANPTWVPGFTPERLPLETVPIQAVAQGVFEGTNPHRNDDQLAQALIRAGADVNVDNGGPLKTAVSYHAPGAVRALLEGGAPVDGPDGGGMPMAYALGFGFTDIAEMLDRFGAQLDLRFAAGLGKLDVVKSFVNSDGTLTPAAGRLDDPYENWFRCERTRANILCQALHFACLNARIEVAEYLLELGADVNQEVPGVNRLGGTALHGLTTGVSMGAGRDPHVYDERRLPLIALLLRHGAHVTMRDSRFHSTPLGWAHHHGAPGIFDLLKPHAGIHDAVQFGLLDRLRELLAANPALVNARDELGQTPLHCLTADTTDAVAIVALLRANGADLGARDQNGLTPYDKARQVDRTELAERLQ